MLSKITLHNSTSNYPINFQGLKLVKPNKVVNFQQKTPSSYLDLIKNYNMPFISFKGNDTELLRGNLSVEERETIINRINNFEKDPNVEHQGISKLGSGAVGVCYKIDLNDKEYAVKVAKPEDQIGEKHKQKDRSFSREAQILSEIPETLQNCQRLIAHVKKDNNYYLITNFLKGKTPDPVSNPYTYEHFNNLLDNLSSLSTSDIIHRDLSNYNILISQESKNPSLVDFEFAEKLDSLKYNDKFNDVCNKSNNPYFYPISNVENFEFRALFPYLLKMSTTHSAKEVRNCFKSYLMAKSKYHLQNAQHIERIKNERKDEFKWKNNLNDDDANNILDKAIEYEKLMANLFKNPNDDVIDIEASRIQLRLFTFFKFAKEHKQWINAAQLSTQGIQTQRMLDDMLFQNNYSGDICKYINIIKDQVSSNIWDWNEHHKYSKHVLDIAKIIHNGRDQVPADKDLIDLIWE